MKVKKIVELSCADCHTPLAPELVVEGEDHNFYLLGKCMKCRASAAINIEKLYAELYSAQYSLAGAN